MDLKTLGLEKLAKTWANESLTSMLTGERHVIEPKTDLKVYSSCANRKFSGLLYRKVWE